MLEICSFLFFNWGLTILSIQATHLFKGDCLDGRLKMTTNSLILLTSEGEVNFSPIESEIPVVIKSPK